MISSFRERTPTTLMSSTTAPSSRFSAGRIHRRMPCALAVCTMGRTPRTGRISPLRPSSPATRTSSKSSCRSISIQISSPTATGRSITIPRLGMSAGARFTVIRAAGSGIPVFFNATRTRSPASRTSPLMNPTMLKAGSPLEIFVSTLSR